jgi:hypothetical protein
MLRSANRQRAPRETPEGGVDCSGLVRYVFQQVTGVTLPRTAKELSKLQDCVPSFPRAEAMATIERELGRKLDELFAEIEPEPVAAASLVDRSGGKADIGVPYKSLVMLNVPAYAPEACPLCRAGSSPVKPGSRGLK